MTLRNPAASKIWSLVSSVMVWCAPVRLPCRPVDAGLRDRGADLLDADAARRQRHRIDPHLHGVGLLAENARFGDAADARQTLRHHRVGVVVEPIDRYRVGMDRVDQHRTVGRVRFAVGRRVRHVARQQAGRRLDRLLHVLRRGVDVAVEIELHRDRRVADPARRTHLGEAGQRREFLFERGGDRRRHRRRAGAGVVGADHDRREIDARQRRHRQQVVGGDPEHQDPEHQQRCRDRAVNERRGNAHRPGPMREGWLALARRRKRRHPVGSDFGSDFEGASRTRDPFVSRYCPSTTIFSPGVKPLLITATPSCTAATSTGRRSTVSSSLIT